MSPLFKKSSSPKVDQFMLPLDGPAETGVDLSFDPIYNAIAEARREENARLPQGVWTHEAKKADWPLVERLCTDALLTRSKDLQLASWLSEAWIHRSAFAGLAQGLALVNGLCRRFWANLYPQIEDGDLTARAAPIEWLNARLPILLRSLPIVVSANNPEESYTWTDYVNAQMLEGLRQRDPKAVEVSEAAGAVTLAAFAAVRARTDSALWRKLNEELEAGRKALAILNQTLGELCGREAPGLGAIGEAMRDIGTLVSVAVAERGSAAPPRPIVAKTNASIPSTPAVSTREEAYAQLAKIADLLQTLEPHSPAPYLIRRAIEWGAMSFGELVVTLAQAGLQLDQVIEVLGLAALIDDSAHVADSGHTKA